MRKTTTLVAVTVSFWLCAGQAEAGLIDYWAGNGNANDSVGPNSGTLMNGVTFGPGVVGQAFQFNGTSYVQAGTVGMPTGDSDRTLDLFFKVDAFRTSESFFAGYGSFGTSNSTYALGTLQNGTVFFSQWGNAIVGPSVQAGNWYNLAVTNVGSLATLYLDGVSVGSKNMDIDTSLNSNFYIGRIPGSLGNSRQLDGSVDEVKLFNEALSADQILALASVPEPASLTLAAIAACTIGLTMGWRRKQKP